MKVPFLRLAAQHKSLGKEIETAVQNVLASGCYVLGKEVERFESRLAKTCSTHYAISVASGTDALELSLRAAGIKAGDFVVVPAFSFFATAGAVLRVGARPLFVDIAAKTFNLDTEALWDVIHNLSARKLEKIKAIIPVHLYGQCVHMRAVLEIAKRYRWIVVEDAAQAIGAQCKGKAAGSIGHMGCFSFYPTKNLGADGDAGAVTTSDGELFQALRSLRAHGVDKEPYIHQRPGVNSRMDEIQAAILNVKFKKLKTWTFARQTRAERYNRLLDGVAEIVPPAVDQANVHVYHQYVIRAEQRDALADYLRHRGIDCMVYYPVPLHRQPCLEKLRMNNHDCPEADQAAREVLALPMYPELSAREQEFVAKTLRQFYGRKPE